MGGAFLGLSTFHLSLSNFHLFNACRKLSIAHTNGLQFAPLPQQLLRVSKRRRAIIAVCMVLDDETAQRASEVDDTTQKYGVPDCLRSSPASATQLTDAVAPAVDSQSFDVTTKRTQRQLRRKGERYAYLSAAIASSVGVTFLAAGAVYYRFAWQLQGGEVSPMEMFGTFTLAVGAAVGMEIWARWAHRVLWHSSLWSMHESHHRPRNGPFELNDIFAIINAIPAIALTAYGFFHKGLVPGLCFGAGLGITVFGIAYMFVHDGLVHRRFPVGPIADVPYLQKVAAAHQLHHADKFHGVPYGLFLGPKELEEVGGREELQRLMKKGDQERQHGSVKEGLVGSDKRSTQP